MATVPTYTSLPDVYPSVSDLQEVTQRYATICERYTEAYHHAPDFYARAPGRVNLIGEHIDYSGYSVLPFALVQDTVVAVGVSKDRFPDADESRDTRVTLRNVDPKFPEKTFHIQRSITIDHSKHDWGNYFLAAYRGILDYIAAHNIATASHPASIHIMMSGNIPPSAGLSSSSALVCVCAVTVMQCLQLNIPKTEIASLCARCERYIGTEGGGMDQAISFLAESGQAQLIDFNPLQAHPVSLPQGVAFVIAHSLVGSEKHATAATNFNLRVVECKLAAALLAHYMKLDRAKVRKLKDCHDMSGSSFPDMVKAIKTHLHAAPYTLDEISSILGISVEDLQKEYMSSGVKVNAPSYELHNRALHVFTEAERVHSLAGVCKLASTPVTEHGELLNASHESCSNLYQCSCEELDQLTELCRRAGAVGSRLTGAGWGGCTVSMVPEAILREFMERVAKEYPPYQALAQADLASYLFATRPGGGACIYVKQ